MNRIKADQEKWVDVLKSEQMTSIYRTKLLQNYLNECQAIIEILQAMMQSGLSWNEINWMIKEEKWNGNILANYIQKVNFEKEKVTVMFDTSDEDADLDPEGVFSGQSKVFVIELDLKLSAQMNVQKYYEIKKKSSVKEEKTRQKAEEAIRTAE